MDRALEQSRADRIVHSAPMLARCGAFALSTRLDHVVITPLDPTVGAAELLVYARLVLPANVLIEARACIWFARLERDDLIATPPT